MARFHCQLMLTGCALVLVAAGCGKHEDESASLSSVSDDIGVIELAEDATTLADVSLGEKTGTSATVTPSYLPKAGQVARDLQIIFYPRFTVKNPKFVYDKSKWAVAVGNNTQLLSGKDIVEVKEDGNFSSGEVREGQIKLTVRLTAQGQWPDKITNESALTVIDNRKSLKLLPYYSLEGGVVPGNSGTLQGLSAALMKDDVGAIIAPASIDSTVVTDGAFSIEFSAPSDTTAEDTTTGEVKSVGKSNVSGFVVVYWKDSECSAGGWTLKPNKVFDKAKTNSDLMCTYPGIEKSIAGADACDLGCDKEQDDGFFGKSDDVVAAPPEFPSETGTENAIKSGCLTIVRVAADGRTSYAVNNAVNGEAYGVMVYPLDSSGNIGSTRSRCIKAQSYNVEFASSRKSPDLGKSKSDCFVATAASGSSQSKTVHYWRVLRDTWLDKLGFSKFYYKHAPTWAAWLDAHPRLKPFVNTVLEWSGKNLVRTSQWALRMEERLKTSFEKLSVVLQSILVSEARADTLALPEATHSDASPAGSAASTLTFGGGQIRPSADKELYDLAYKDKKPGFLFVSQSFRLFDFFGEFGVGYEFTGLLLRGTSADATQTPITLTGYGAGLVGEYRLRVGNYPWVSPRFSAVYGKMRMREEASTVSAAGGSSTTSSDISPSGTTPVWQTYSTYRVFLDLSIPRIYGDDENLIRYGYEAEDMTLSFFAGMNTNDGKVISTSGLQLGGAISFMFK